jgi:hypothetical protein
MCNLATVYTSRPSTQSRELTSKSLHSSTPVSDHPTMKLVFAIDLSPIGKISPWTQPTFASFLYPTTSCKSCFSRYRLPPISFGFVHPFSLPGDGPSTPIPPTHQSYESVTLSSPSIRRSPSYSLTIPSAPLPSPTFAASLPPPVLPNFSDCSPA